ncbi:phenoloxidase-activating factor 2-like [Episyrphus balteatus]|uniref:phenoloxidase-activating factor 2-like n=1 Tax=Episyrphus balteatus TaxID=286459 RepID=UPI002485FAD0|nr:phenoloxidase-activating factor 2-like [Episyrphus balteatus]
MSAKLVLFVFVAILFGSSLELMQLSGAVSAENQKEDAEIRKILYGEPSNIKQCLNVSMSRKTGIKINETELDKPLWTVVILKEEIILKDKIINIQQCTGSLINTQVVLTATHCTYNKTKNELKVRAGEGTFQQERRIRQVIYQNKKKYNITMPMKDIALIFLKTRFDHSPHVRTICLLPKPVQKIAPNVQCFVTGWVKKAQDKPGCNFKKIAMSTIRRDRCEQVLRLTGLGGEFELDKSFMCAGGDFDKGALDVYGGAPLVCPICGSSGIMAQVGVMSWGFKTPPLPEVLTSISSAHSWIVNQLKRKKFKLPDCGI